LRPNFTPRPSRRHGRARCPDTWRCCNYPAVDWLSRDTNDLLVIARDMQRAGAGLRSVAERVVDTTSEFAELVLAMLGVAAKLERRRIAERSLFGSAETRAAAKMVAARAKVRDARFTMAERAFSFLYFVFLHPHRLSKPHKCSAVTTCNAVAPSTICRSPELCGCLTKPSNGSGGLRGATCLFKCRICRGP
jgi:hypothetical protein